MNAQEKKIDLKMGQQDALHFPMAHILFSHSPKIFDIVAHNNLVCFKCRSNRVENVPLIVLLVLLVIPASVVFTVALQQNFLVDFDETNREISQYCGYCDACRLRFAREIIQRELDQILQAELFVDFLCDQTVTQVDAVHKAADHITEDLLMFRLIV